MSVQVFIGSLITGLQKDLVETTIGRSSQVTVTAVGRGGTIGDWASVEAMVRSVAGVTEVSPAADASGFVNFADEAYPVLVRGLDFEKAKAFTS